MITEWGIKALEVQTEIIQGGILRSGQPHQQRVLEDITETHKIDKKKVKALSSKYSIGFSYPVTITVIYSFALSLTE